MHQLLRQQKLLQQAWNDLALQMFDVVEAIETSAEIPDRHFEAHRQAFDHLHDAWHEWDRAAQALYRQLSPNE